MKIKKNDIPHNEKIRYRFIYMYINYKVDQIFIIYLILNFKIHPQLVL